MIIFFQNPPPPGLVYLVSKETKMRLCRCRHVQWKKWPPTVHWLNVWAELNKKPQQTHTHTHTTHYEYEHHNMEIPIFFFFNGILSSHSLFERHKKKSRKICHAPQQQQQQQIALKPRTLLFSTRPSWLKNHIVVWHVTQMKKNTKIKESNGRILSFSASETNDTFKWT